MDLSLISAATSALGAARDMAKAAAGLRDFNQVAAALTELRMQLIQAHDSLFAHQGELLSMQQELFRLKDALRQKEAALAEAQHEIAKLKQKRLELDQYERFRHAGGGWAYRRKDAAPADVDAPTYCAPCFENEQLSLLHPGTGEDRSYLSCPQCGFRMRRR